VAEARSLAAVTAEVTSNCFTARDSQRQKLAYVYFEDKLGD
jgi:hypothetical protein